MKILYWLLLALGFSGAAAADEGPLTLEQGSWVCQSPEAYDEIVAKQRDGTSPHKLQKELQTCIFMDDDNIEDMMAPFVQVLAREGDKAKVSFVVEHYKRIEYLHRKFSRMTYTGWTESANIKQRS